MGFRATVRGLAYEMAIGVMTMAIMSIGLTSCGGGDDGPGALDGGIDATTTDSGGGGIDGGTDAGTDAGRDGAAGRCGDGVVDEGEACDDANTQNDDFCNRDCTNACGDGVVNAVETCDVAIESGDGSCPTGCDDANACTTDVLDGVDCAATCLNAPITACVSGDGCCAAGCTSLDDDDCASECGNGALEAGELCEDGTDVPCPTDCDDGLACTTDLLVGAGTCEATCMNVGITACSATSDGCCAPGCNAANDADCSASCGNGVLEAGELCENGSATPCPTSCNDGNACTTDALRGSAASCNAQCGFTPITMCRATSDGCCAPGCNATNDGDCAPVCGNRVVEAGEQCDDGNMTPGDGCEGCRTVVTPTAFRMNDLDLRDPHAFTRVFFCADITSTLNTEIQNAIRGDDDGDGFLDLSYLLVFRPLAQTAMGGTMEVRDGDCRTSTSCVGVSPVLATASYRNLTTGTCLDTRPGGTSVVRPYTPAVATPAAPCFVSDPVELTVTISGIAIRLREAQVAGTYSGSPATALSNGLLRGFITEADAAATVLPADLPAVGGMSLAAVLRGGPGNCASGSDQDRHPTHGVGWWFFLNFPAGVVTTYSE